MTFKTKLTTAIATGAVLLNALAPIALAQTITVTGNGAQSENKVEVESNNTSVVNQSNNANVTNNIDSNASTGGNSASLNTGGKTIILTGDAKTNVDVTTAVNLNKVDLKNCGVCDGGPVNVTISGNGANSENKTNVENNNSLFVAQDNNADISNQVDAKASTGKNDASLNTGGDSTIWTGNATTNVSVNNIANANFANVGGSSADPKGSDITITGNGANSENKAKLETASAIVLSQDNNADISNEVDANAKTGKNDSSFNTGGQTVVMTGDANTNVDVKNLANFNAANIDCECVLESLTAKIGGNGADSENKVKSENENSLFNAQDNLSGLFNEIDGKAKTGYNDVSFSTGTPEGDPAISTGNADSSTDVNNAGNVNIYNEGVNLHIPGNLENVDFGFDFNIGSILSFFHLG